MGGRIKRREKGRKVNKKKNNGRENKKLLRAYWTFDIFDQFMKHKVKLFCQMFAKMVSAPPEEPEPLLKEPESYQTGPECVKYASKLQRSSDSVSPSGFCNTAGDDVGHHY